MARKKDSTVLSFSLKREDESELEEYLEESDYRNRSELVRDALRSFIRRRKEIAQMGGFVEGVVVLLYDHSADKEVSEIRHEEMGSMIRSYTHCDMHVTGEKCCEVLFVSGRSENLRELVEAFQAVKGVEEAEVFLA